MLHEPKATAATGSASGRERAHKQHRHKHNEPPSAARQTVSSVLASNMWPADAATTGSEPERKSQSPSRTGPQAGPSNKTQDASHSNPYPGLWACASNKCAPQRPCHFLFLSESLGEPARGRPDRSRAQAERPSQQRQQQHRQQPPRMRARPSSRGGRVAGARALLLATVLVAALEGAAQALAAGHSARRSNELDVFLDDMSHNELRDVAAGKPIDEALFAAKAQPSSSEALAHGESAERGQHAKEAHIYSECALILQRTYVKNLDEPKRQATPVGKTEQACISYKHIDKAVEQAKHVLKFRDLLKRRKKQRPLEVLASSLEPPEELVAALGELNMLTTQIIADQFDLSNDELLNGLPLIDMSRTKLWPICPRLVRLPETQCRPSRFRSPTAHCNNLKHPTWGAAMTPFSRYLPPVHPDGVWAPRRSVLPELAFEHQLGGGGDGEPLPGPVPVPLPLPVPVPPPPMGEPQLGDLRAHALPRHQHVHAHRHLHVHGGDDDQLAFHRDTLRLMHHRQLAGPAAPLAAASEPLKLTLERVFGASASPVTPVQARLQRDPMRASGSNAAAASSRRAAAAELPSARLVTSVVHHDVDLPNHDLSILFMSWGQLLDHDMTRAAQSPPSIKCCGPSNGEPRHPLCMPIRVPEHDPFYGRFGVDCLEFRRSLAGLRPSCVLGPRVHQNAITAPIDANFVYGSSRAMADELRLFKGGRLRDRDWFHREGLKPLLPAQEREPDADCIGRPRELFCFLAGDVRANEQTHLTVLHTVYMRFHNSLVDRFAALNPHWDDERLYQEARHVVAASVQHVMLNEYLPLLIGRKMCELYNLTARAGQEPHYWHGYDASVTTSVANSFAAAAFRQGHTFVQGTVERYNKLHELVASEKLRNLFKRPFLLYQAGAVDELVAGMLNQPAQSYDPFISEEISGHLFQAPEASFGHDLAAINLQRGRDQGLPGYNVWREWCGLPRAHSFHQLEPYLTNQTAHQYARLYRHVDDIDLWSGGVSERKLPGAAVGPTFACILARQFSNTRRGDRFWYENPDQPSSFTPEQLAEVRKITLARLLCAHADDLPTVQRWALRLAHPVLNPRLACHELPEPDLGFWQEE